jgi:cysteine-rich repeat protein
MLIGVRRGGAMAVTCAVFVAVSCGDGLSLFTDAAGAEGSEETAGSSTTDGPSGACGDGRIDPGEDCDDANEVDNDTCHADCSGSSRGRTASRKGSSALSPLRPRPRGTSSSRVRTDR